MGLRQPILLPPEEYKLSGNPHQISFDHMRGQKSQPPSLQYAIVGQQRESLGDSDSPVPHRSQPKAEQSDFDSPIYEALPESAGDLDHGIRDERSQDIGLESGRAYFNSSRVQMMSGRRPSAQIAPEDQQHPSSQLGKIEEEQKNAEESFI